jgi:hypothetical protein
MPLTGSVPFILALNEPGVGKTADAARTSACATAR